MIINSPFSMQFTFQNPFLCDLFHLSFRVKLGEQHSDSCSTAQMHEAGSSRIQPEQATWAQHGMTSTMRDLCRPRSLASPPGQRCLSSTLSLFARGCLEKPSRANFPEALNHTPEQFQSFKHIGTFDHYDNPTPKVLFLLPFYRKGNSGSEKLGNSPKITQQVSGLRQDSAELHLPK